ncbi:unnamed protein product [Schistosoma haematobium]|nr:unnamed protein product [Schistosoma haematobium]
MACQSVLIVAGRIDRDSNQEKLSKLLYDGLLAAFGEDLDKLDAQFLNCLTKPVNAIDSKEYGSTLEYVLRENISIRVLFNPTSDQLRFGLQEALSHVIVNNNSVVEYPVTPSTLGKVCMVYNGQLHGFTGDWLLQDSSFSGNNLLLWLNSEEAMSWWPYLKKFSNFGDQIKLHIITPIAGTGTCWPVDKSGRPHTVLTQINTRMAKIDILIEASWRLNGKPLNIHGNLSGFEGLRSFVDHVIHQHPITTIQSDLNSISTGTALNTTRPVIYIFPGHGIASQSCALFAIQGFTALLGGSYTSQTVPNWWSMVKHLPKLDVTLLPDWCPSSILTYRFMTQLLKSGQDSIGILGEILVPPGNTSSTEGLSDISTGLILTPPSLISGPHQGTWASSSNPSNDTIPSSVVLYSKLGWGELKLQPLSHRSGLVLIWESVVHDFTSQQPLCIVMPSVLPTNTNPVQNLTRFIKGLCQIPQLSGPTLNRTIKSVVKLGTKQLVRAQPARPSKPTLHATGQKETITSKTANSTMNAKPSPTKPISSTPNHNQRTATTTPLKTPSLAVNQLKKPINENTTNSKLMNNSHGVDSHQKRPLSSVDTKKTFSASKPHVATTKPVNGESKTTNRPLSGPKATPLAKPKTTTTTMAERLTAHSNLVNQHGSKAPPRKSEPTTHLPNKLQTKKTSNLTVTSNRLPSAKPVKEESETVEQTTELVDSSLPPATLQNISLNNELTSVDPMLNSLMKSSIHENSENHLDNLSLTNQFVITDNKHIISTGTSLQREKEEEEQREVVKQPQHEVEEKEEEYKVHKVLKENQMLAEESDEQLTIDLECELKPTTPLSCDDSLAEGEEVEEEVVEEEEEHDHEVVEKEMNSFNLNQYEQNQVTEEEIVSSLGFHDMQSYKTPFDTPFDVGITESSTVFETDSNKSIGNSVVIEQHEPQHLEQNVEDELNRNVDIEDNQTYVNHLQEESLPFIVNKQSLVENSHDINYLTTMQETGQNDNIFESEFNVNNVLKEQQVVERNEENFQDGGEQRQPEKEFNLGTQDLSYEKEDIICHRYDNSMSVIGNGLSPLTNKTLKLDEQMFPCNDDAFVTTPGEMDNSFDKIQSQRPIEEGYYEQIKQYPDEGETIQMEGREKLLNYSVDHSQDELSSFHAVTDIDANITSDLMPDFTDPRFSNVTEQPHFKEEEKSGNEDECEIHYQPQPTEETYDENVQDVQYVQREQIAEHFNDTISQLQDQLSPSVFEKELVEEPHELLQSSNDLDTEQKVIEEADVNETEPKVIDSNKIEGVNIIGPSDFLTEVIPLSDEQNNVHVNQPYSYVPEDYSLQNDDDDNEDDKLTKFSRTDVVKAMDNEPVYKQTHINLIAGEQTHLTQTAADEEEEEEEVTNLDNIQYHDDVIDHSSQPYNVQTHAHLDEKSEEGKLNKSFTELTANYEENYVPNSTETEYEQKHEQYLSDQETHIDMDHLQLDHHKQIEETHSDIDEMEKEFVIPYQQKQINTECDESSLSHINIDYNVNYDMTTDDYNRTMNSHEIHSQQNIESEVGNVSLEQDIGNAQDDEMLPDNSLLSTATTYPSDPTKYQVDSSTDQIINNIQTLEGFPYNNHYLSDETNFTIQRKVETNEIDEESHQKVDSTTYEESHIVSHDIHNDIDSPIEIHSNSYQELNNSLHIDTATNVEGHHQQQFISPDSEISDNSTVQVQQHYEERVQECEHQQDEQHSEADLLIYSPNRSVSPNYNIVSSTQQHSNEEEEEEDRDYVGDDTVVYHNDAVTMSKESDIDRHQDQHYQQFDVDEKLLENSTINGFSNYSNAVHQQQHLYSEIPTDDSEETMMQRMTMMMSTNVDVNNNDNDEITDDTTTTKSGNSHVNLEQQYFNGNTIYQTNDNVNDIDHSIHITPITNHHLQDSYIAHTNGFNVCANGNEYSNLKTNEINEDENQDEIYQNQWNKSNNHYLSETAIDDMNFSKDSESDYMKAAHMTHSCHEEEDEERSYMIMTTTPPPSATSTTATTTTPSKDMENFGKFFIDKDQFLQDIRQNTSSHCSPTEEKFDPLKAWGHPLGLPAPVPPTTNHSKLHQQTNLTKRVRSADTSGKALNTDDSTLPPGPPVYLDAIWVPSYLVRVPQSLIVEFFIRVRAKLYILSGEALHPNIAEALITAKTKWNPDDVSYLCRCDANSPDASITILPTDEPKEWIRWLETPCGRLDEQKGSDRLKANHFHLLPAANLCSTQFNDGDTIFECEGLRVEL